NGLRVILRLLRPNQITVSTQNRKTGANAVRWSASNREVTSDVNMNTIMYFHESPMRQMSAIVKGPMIMPSQLKFAIASDSQVVIIPHPHNWGGCMSRADVKYCP